MSHGNSRLPRILTLVRHGGWTSQKRRAPGESMTKNASGVLPSVPLLRPPRALIRPATRADTPPRSDGIVHPCRRRRRAKSGVRERAQLALLRDEIPVTIGPRARGGDVEQDRVH